MARMYPSPLPESLRQDPKRQAEVRFYDALATQLPDQYLCFYSFSWLEKFPSGRALDGEADFVVVHPKRGILLIEIKGGGIGFNGATGKWTSTDRHGRDHAIDDPVQQAIKSKYALINKLKYEPAWRGTWIDAGHAIAFPDTLEARHALKADLPRDIVLFFQDMSHLDHCLTRVFDFWSGTTPTKPIGNPAVESLISTLAPTFQLRNPLAVQMEYEDQRIIELTSEQVNVLELLRWQPRVAISGGAGTGKTLLAVHKARQLAQSGHKTVLLTFNRPLADSLQQSNADLETLRICTFHRFCVEVASQAGLDVCMPRDADARKRYYELELPMLMVDGLADRPELQVEAVVVDEGQDFAVTWWNVLELALSDPRDSKSTLYVFHDDNQRIYQRGSGIPKDMVRIPLSQNLRNTRRIFDCLRVFYRGSDFECRAPQGRPVELIRCDCRDCSWELSKILHRLIREEGVRPADVAILTGRDVDKTDLARCESIGAFPITRGGGSTTGSEVLLESIHRFKGLERRVVILTELEQGLTNEELLYVGLSRARLHLTVLGSQAVLDRIRVHETVKQ